MLPTPVSPAVFEHLAQAQVVTVLVTDVNRQRNLIAEPLVVGECSMIRVRRRNRKQHGKQPHADQDGRPL